ncbi:MAG: DEAD/DEAH box helicase [Atribacterota bacterium]
MSKLMKIKNLKNYGIPSYILDIWKKHYSPYLLPVQEEAVKNFGVLDSRFRENDRHKNLLVIAPTSSGKTFIGEMAAVYQVIHQKKTIFIVPSRALAREKYWHFKNLYECCGLETVLFSRDRKEDDYRLIIGDYKLAVMSYEKFYYFLLKFPEFLTSVSLIVMNEVQMIDNPRWGPILKEVIDLLRGKYMPNLRIIALSTLIENQKALLKWFPAHPFISHQHPQEIRKGIVRKGVFKYITSNKKKTFKKEIFFKPNAVRDNCFKDYLLETVRYFVNKDEPTLVFFTTSAETRKWAKWLASQLETPAASSALRELAEMEETLSREELSELLKKGIAYYSQDLSWEEKNLVETYLKKGEIKLVCSTITLSTGVHMPFKNVIVPQDMLNNFDENCPHNYRRGLTFFDIENMSGSARVSGFGRVIFLAYSLLTETIFHNLYFNYNHNYNHYRTSKTQIKKVDDLLTFLLYLLSKYNCQPEKIKNYLREGKFIFPGNQNKSAEKEDCFCGYWQFSFNQDNLEEKIDNYLNILKENKLIRENRDGILSPTINGTLITAKNIKVETYLFLKNWMKHSKKGEISDLEILLLLAFSPNGMEIFLPCSSSCRDTYKKERYNLDWTGNYWNKLLQLVFEQDEEDKKIYQDILILKKEKEEKLEWKDYLAFKKTHLLYDWIKESKDIKTLEQEYDLYGGTIRRLVDNFSWLTDSLAEIAESEGWGKDRKDDLNKIKRLSKRLIDGVEEDGLNLSQLYIPGLSRYYIRKLVEAGYSDKKCFKETSEEKLRKVLPERLVKRIQKMIKEEKEILKGKRQKMMVEVRKLEDRKRELETNKLTPEAGKLEPEFYSLKSETENYKSRLIAEDQDVAIRQPLPKKKNYEPKIILEIDQHRPDRIIFEEKEIKLTPLAFSLIYLLAQNRGKVLSYNYISDTLWKEDKDATYHRLWYHLSNAKNNIIKRIGKNKKNQNKIKNLLKVIRGRGLILNIEEKQLKIL